MKLVYLILAIAFCFVSPALAANEQGQSLYRPLGDLAEPNRPLGDLAEPSESDASYFGTEFGTCDNGTDNCNVYQGSDGQNYLNQQTLDKLSSRTHTNLKVSEEQVPVCYYYKNNTIWNDEGTCEELGFKNGKTFYVFPESSSTTSGVDVVIQYFGPLISISIKIGLLVSILIIVAGGIMISVSGSSEENQGKDILISGLVALGILVLGGTILHTINPLFFVW